MALVRLTPDVLADQAAKLIAAAHQVLEMRRRTIASDCPGIGLNAGNFNGFVDKSLQWLKDNSGTFDVRLEEWNRMREKVGEVEAAVWLAVKLNEQPAPATKKRK